MSPRRQGSQCRLHRRRSRCLRADQFSIWRRRSRGFDAADYFVAGNARELQAGVRAGDRGGVGVADAAGFYADANLAGCGLGDGRSTTLRIFGARLLPLCRCFSLERSFEDHDLSHMCGFVCFSALYESDLLQLPSM